jgi:hypothetical protein
MSVVTRAYSETNGQIAYATSVNRVIDDLYTLQAGNINSANIANSGVGAGNLETSSVITRTIDASAVTAPKVADAAVQARAVDHEVQFYHEVFS